MEAGKVGTTGKVGKAGEIGIEKIKEKMEELAEKQSWIRHNIAKIMEKFYEKVIPKNLERFRFKYKIGSWEYAYDLYKYYYFYITEDGVFILEKEDYSYEESKYDLTNEEEIKNVPIFILRNLGKEFDNILAELKKALEKANENYGEAVKKLQILQECLETL